MTQSAEHIFEQWLVLQSQSGDKEALRMLVKRWNPRLVRHARRFTNDRESAKDTAQESWIAIIRNIKSVDDPARFGAWALRIVGRKAIDWMRKSQRIQRNAEYHAETVHGNDDEAEEDDDRITILRAAMRNLPELQRHTLSLFYLEGYSIKEISEILEQPIGTIKARLFHAREHLKKMIKTQHHEKEV